VKLPNDFKRRTEEIDPGYMKAANWKIIDTYILPEITLKVTNRVPDILRLLLLYCFIIRSLNSSDWAWHKVVVTLIFLMKFSSIFLYFGVNKIILICRRSFLINSGADESNFLVSTQYRLQNHRTKELLAAKGTQIATYGKRKLSLALGGRRDLFHSFWLADVSHSSSAQISSSTTSLPSIWSTAA